MMKNDISTTLKSCPYCKIGVIRITYGIRAGIEECTNCDSYLRIEHNQAAPNPLAGQPLYKHTFGIEVAAIKTLEQQGYTYNGELWEPPQDITV